MDALSNTIVAVSTPPGRGGIGVIRISGAGALEATRHVVGDDSFIPQPNRVYLRSFNDPSSGELIDRGLVTYFKSPYSFTGEDVVELSCHGSPTVLLRIIDVLLNTGLRAADPGEFTLRAVANNKLNLSQAEAVRDLINSQTSLAAKHAVRQLDGLLSATLQPIKQAILDVIVPLESAIEFVEEDLPTIYFDEVWRKVLKVIDKTETLASTYNLGRAIKDGYKVVLAGRPNVGKSSIFNALLAYERSIVTDIPGTTRDALSEYISINDIPVLLTDTAGVRSSEDRVEQLGVERTRRAIADADLVLTILDGSGSLTSEDYEIISIVESHSKVTVVNKIDVLADTFTAELARAGIGDYIQVSAKNESGLSELRRVIVGSLSGDCDVREADFLITNSRHYDSLRCTIKSLQETLDSIDRGAGEELIVVGLHNALTYLGNITGETTTEDVLDEVFSTFCIGK